MKVILLAFLVFCTLNVCQAQRPADNMLMDMERKAQEYMQQEKFQEAALIFDKIITTTRLERESDFMALYRRAICYYYLMRVEEAMKDLNAFMPHNPGRSTPFVLRSFLHRSLDDFPNALADLNQALSMNTGEQDSTQLLRLRATNYLELKRFSEAIKDIQFAMKDQKDPEGLGILAFAYFNMDDEQLGLQAVHQSIELDFSYLPVYLYAATYLLEKAKYEQALIYSRLATMADDTSPDAWFYQGVALVNLNNLDQGCSCLNKAFYGGNDNAEGYLTQFCYPSEN